MTSRLTRARPACPRGPSRCRRDTVIVPNSIGNAAGVAHALLGALGQRSSGMLHGVTSFHDEATPTCGLSQSSSVMPTARSIARAGAFCDAVGDVRERGLMSTLVSS